MFSLPQAFTSFDFGPVPGHFQPALSSFSTLISGILNIPIPAYPVGKERVRAEKTHCRIRTVRRGTRKTSGGSVLHVDSAWSSHAAITPRRVKNSGGPQR